MTQPGHQSLSGQQDTGQQAGTASRNLPVEPGTFEQRLSSVIEGVKAESKSGGTEEEKEPIAGPSPPSLRISDTSKVEPAAGSDEQAKAERQKRLEQLEVRERARVDRKAREKEQTRARQAAESEQMQALRARLGELEQLADMARSPAGLLALAETNGIAPHDIGRFLTEAIANPTKMASIEARRALTPVEQQLRGEIAQMRGELRSIAGAHIKSQHDQAEKEAAKLLVAGVRENSRTSPYTNAFIEEFGQDAFVTYATAIAEELEDDVGLQALLDMLEDDLESFGRLENRVQKVRGVKASPLVQSSQSKANGRSPAARASATTVSNRLAAARSSIADEDDAWASLPFDERLKRIKSSP